VRAQELCFAFGVCSPFAIHIELVHRHRAESRVSTIDGHISPTWEQIQARAFDPWESARRIDTSLLSVEESVSDIMNFLRQIGTDQIYPATCSPTRH
jgi:hypothetical protein